MVNFISKCRVRKILQITLFKFNCIQFLIYTEIYIPCYRFLCSFFTEAASKVPSLKSVSELEVEKKLKDWLRHAPARLTAETNKGQHKHRDNSGNDTE